MELRDVRKGFRQLTESTKSLATSPKKGPRGPHLERAYDALEGLTVPTTLTRVSQNVAEGTRALVLQAQNQRAARLEVPKSGPITDDVLALLSTRPPATVRKQIDRLASLEVYRLFDHPTRDAAIRETVELDLRATHRVRQPTLDKVVGRPEIPLRLEQVQRRNALVVLLSRPKLFDELAAAAIAKLGEVGVPGDEALIDKVARRRGGAVQEAASVAKASIARAANMTIVIAAFESKPYVNGGGLGNVMKELPPALARQGHNVIVVLPRHSVIDRSALQETGEVGVVYGPKTEQFGLFKDRRDGVDYYFIENDRFFSSGRNGVYRDSYGDYGDTFERYDFFGAALPVAIRHILGREAPDVVQLNDAHTATAATYLAADPAFRDTATVMAIHNLGAAYQGRCEQGRVSNTRLDDLGKFYPGGPVEAWGEVNLMKLGLTESDAAITVSRQYMLETLTEEAGEGMHGVLQELRAKDRLWGNLNGIDTSAWNSETDPLLTKNFSFEDQSGKAACKSALQQTYGLPARPDAPLFGVVARLSGQKGIDDIVSSARRALDAGSDLQLVVCGEGEDKLRGQMEQLARDYPNNVAFDPKFQPEKEHTILGGSDFFLMPSRFEPCGLPQMYALRYLTVPIVRAVGGLEESIEDFDPAAGTGTGFKFSDDLSGAIDRALAWYGRGPEERQTLIENCARADFSWDNASAPEQLAFYRKTLNAKNAS